MGIGLLWSPPSPGTQCESSGLYTEIGGAHPSELGPVFADMKHS